MHRPHPTEVYENEVKDLLSRMTVGEKLGQLQQLTWTGGTGPGGGQTEEVERAARAGLLGSVLNLHGAAHTNTLQRMAVEESRLGIPLVFGLDVIHGFWTTFPIPLAQASSFDPEVAVRDAEVSAKEARSNGIRWTFAPMMDVTHEPRWGRIAESCGEDPHLNAVLAVAKTRAYQGDDLAADDRLAACAKHFVAYGGAEGGRDYNTVDVSEQRLRNLYLPPFKAAVDAGVATVMAAFNTVSGVPAHGNPHTMTGILKEEWGFGGVVVSDYTGVEELIAHGYAADGADAARLALTAGLDMEMVSTHIAGHGARLLADGLITEERLDDAVARVLALKFALGLFDDPYTDESAAVDEPTPTARAAARYTAARSMVLLKNDGGALPLDAAASGTIAVAGPFADHTDLHGTWAGPGCRRFPSVSLLDAVRAAAPAATVTHAGGGAEAVAAAARAADVTILAVGEEPGLSGEAAVRADIALPEGQAELIAAVAATGKPFVVVLLNGRPLTIGDWVDGVPAILEAWHPGIEAGHAIADVLFGAVTPGGKLPVSFPRAVGQIPVYYNRENTGRPHDPGSDEKYVSRYLDLADGPQFVFGHGLSYTTFTTGEPRLGRPVVSVGELDDGTRIDVRVTVTNTGERTGDEVVQLYVHDPVASIAQPVRRLRGFERVTLAPGESRELAFTLGADDLGFWTNDQNGRYVIEPGAIDVYAGTSSRAEPRATLTVTR